MALPGLQLGEIPVHEDTLPVVLELQSQTEWRFEVAFGDNVEVKLLSGTAELFGTELAINQTYTFNGRKAAIYTWHGCRLEILGDRQTDYSAEETPMTSYSNLHFALENLRTEAASSSKDGPRVLLVGPENAGKTSLAKILAAYATRSGRTPIVANLDAREGMLSIPGTISAVALESIVDVEEGWGSSPINGPSQIPVKLPLVYYYGQEDLESQKELSKPLIRRLALSIVSRMEDDHSVKHAGCIIDTPGSISQGKANYDLIQHAVSEFAVNVLVVIGSERLYSEMTRRFSKPSGMAVLKLDKSGGCVDRDPQYLSQMRREQVREYFFGDPRAALNPHTLNLDFAEVVIWKAADASSLLTSLLPGDSEAPEHSQVLEKVDPSPMMQNGVLALVQADAKAKPEHVRDASVIGFLYAVDVDEKKSKMRLLAPLGGRLPRQALIWGQWPEPVSDLVG